MLKYIKIKALLCLVLFQISTPLSLSVFSLAKAEGEASWSDDEFEQAAFGEFASVANEEALDSFPDIDIDGEEEYGGKKAASKTEAGDINSDVPFPDIDIADNEGDEMLKSHVNTQVKKTTPAKREGADEIYVRETENVEDAELSWERSDEFSGVERRKSPANVMSSDVAISKSRTADMELSKPKSVEQSFKDAKGSEKKAEMSSKRSDERQNERQKTTNSSAVVNANSKGDALPKDLKVASASAVDGLRNDDILKSGDVQKNETQKGDILKKGAPNLQSSTQEMKKADNQLKNEKAKSTGDKEKSAMIENKAISNDDVSSVNTKDLRIAPRNVYSHRVDQQDIGLKSAQQIVKKDGASINDVLFQAIEDDNVQAVRAALNKGAHINAIDNEYNTPLLRAIKLKKYDAARYLITRGAQLNYANNQKITALHLAFMKNNVELANILVMSGADLESLDDKYKRPLVYLSIKKLTAIESEALKRFSLRYSNPNNLLLDSVEIGYAAGAKIALDRKAYVNFRDSYCPHSVKNTPLMTAMMRNDMATVHVLLQNGADMNMKNKNGMNPILYAKSQQNKHLLDVLRTVEVQRSMRQ